MDRFHLETASDLAFNYARSMAVRVWGDEPKPHYDNPCCDCKRDFAELIEVEGYGRCCPQCAPAAIEFMRFEEPEAVPAEFVSECCGAGLRVELVLLGRDPETGYCDDGEVTVCAQCGQETEPVLVECIQCGSSRKTVQSDREVLGTPAAVCCGEVA